MMMMMTVSPYPSHKIPRIENFNCTVNTSNLALKSTRNKIFQKLSQNSEQNFQFLDFVQQK